MSTLDEVEGLYDERKARPAACSGRNSIFIATALIDITCVYLWASVINTSTDEVAIFDFGPGIRSTFNNKMLIGRALTVRSDK